MAEEINTDGTEEGEPSELRKAADRGREAVSENETLKRELAFLKAGVNTDTPIGQMFTKAYEGELTTEAIQAQASEVGLGAQAAPTPEPETVPTESAPTPEQTLLTDLRQGVATGEPPSGEQKVNAKAVAMQEYNSALQNGESRRDASVAYFGTLFTEAANGNPTAIFDQEAWNAEADRRDG